MEQPSDATIEIARSTMTGDLAQAYYDLTTGTFDECWQKLPQRDQHKFIGDLKDLTFRAVDQCLAILRADGAEAIQGTLGKLTTDGQQITVPLVMGFELATIGDLAKSLRAPVRIIVDDARRYQGERRPLMAMPDEPELPIEAEELGASAEEERTDPVTGEVIPGETFEAEVAVEAEDDAGTILATAEEAETGGDIDTGPRMGEAQAATATAEAAEEQPAGGRTRRRKPGTGIVSPPRAERARGRQHADA